MKQTLAAEIIADQELINLYRRRIINMLFMTEDVDQISEIMDTVADKTGLPIYWKAVTMDMIRDYEDEDEKGIENVRGFIRGYQNSRKNNK